jgi:hypothetical protein
MKYVIRFGTLLTATYAGAQLRPMSRKAALRFQSEGAAQAHLERLRLIFAGNPEWDAGLVDNARIEQVPA